MKLTPPTLDALRDLERRLAEASKGDSYIDEAIGAAFGVWWIDPSPTTDGASWGPWSQSLDAAVSLVERVRPGWRWIVDSDWDRGPPYAAQVKQRGANWSEAPRAFAPTPALAPCLALVRAVIAESELRGDHLKQGEASPSLPEHEGKE